MVFKSSEQELINLSVNSLLPKNLVGKKQTYTGLNSLLELLKSTVRERTKDSMEQKKSKKKKTLGFSVGVLRHTNRQIHANSQC
jgi:hypothetical protein